MRRLFDDAILRLYSALPVHRECAGACCPNGSPSAFGRRGAIPHHNRQTVRPNRGLRREKSRGNAAFTSLAGAFLVPAERKRSAFPEPYE